MDSPGLILKSSVLHLDNEARTSALQKLAFVGLRSYFEATGDMNISMRILNSLAEKAANDMNGMLEKKKEAVQHQNIRQGGGPKTATPLGHTKGRPNLSRPDATEHYPFADSYGSVFDVLQSHTESNYLVMGAPAQRRFASKVFEEFRFEKKGLKIKDIPEALKGLGLPVTSALVKACSTPESPSSGNSSPDYNNNNNNQQGSDENNKQGAVVDTFKHIKLAEWLHLLNRYTCRSSSAPVNSSKTATRAQQSESASVHFATVNGTSKGNGGISDDDEGELGDDKINEIGRHIIVPINKLSTQKSILKVRDTYTTKIRKVQSRIGDQIRKDKVAWEKTNPNHTKENTSGSKLNIEANRRRVEHLATSTFLLEEKMGKSVSSSKKNNPSSSSSALASSSFNMDNSGVSEDSNAMKITNKFLKSEVGKLFAMSDYSDRYASVNTSSQSDRFDESSTISEINLLAANNYKVEGSSSESAHANRAATLNQLDRDHPSIALKAVRIEQALDKHTVKALVGSKTMGKGGDVVNNHNNNNNNNNTLNNDSNGNDHDLFSYRTKSTRNGWSADFGKPNSVFLKKSSANDSSSSGFNSSGISDVSSQQEKVQVVVVGGGMGMGSSSAKGRVVQLDNSTTTDTDVSSSSNIHSSISSNSSSQAFMETISKSLALKSAI